MKTRTPSRFPSTRSMLSLRSTNQDVSNISIRKRSLNPSSVVVEKSEKVPLVVVDGRSEPEKDVDEESKKRAKEGMEKACAEQSTPRRVGSTWKRFPSAAIMHDEVQVEVDKEEEKEGVKRQEKMKEHHLVVNYHLETIYPNFSSTYRFITAQVLCRMMTTMTDAQFEEKYMLIDCRYTFEYNGGHIRNAINFFDKDDVYSLFFDENRAPRTQRIPIFYCEYSQKRGPSMAYALRLADRQLNMAMYPQCVYEELYVLHEGFGNFFQYALKTNNESLCEPFHYVKMTDPEYKKQLKGEKYHQRRSAQGRNESPENENMRRQGRRGQRNTRQRNSPATRPVPLDHRFSPTPSPKKTPLPCPDLC